MNAAGLTPEANAASEAEVAPFRPAADAAVVIPGEKEETVYVKADASGMPSEKSVEVILKEIAGQDLIEDRSDLRDIKNTEGDEEFYDAGDGRYIWQNHGGEIRYKGISDRELPVDTHVTYYLEGQPVTADEIAGKTGAVRIRFDYDNHTDVPFMVLSSAILPSDVFKDIEVTNGRVMDLGEQKAVIGIAFPGLGERLGLADYEPTEEIDLPEYVEIEARTDKFELDFTATVISTGLFDEVDDEDLRDFEDMSDDMDELADASSELADAAGELADGGEEFGDYLSQYFGGLSKISEGTDALDQGLGALSGNISKLSEGSRKLQQGLAQLDKSLAGVDLTSLTSEEGEKAAAEAGEALRLLSEGSAVLAEKLGAANESISALQEFARKAGEYKVKADALAEAVNGYEPAPLAEKAESAASVLADPLEGVILDQARSAYEEKAGEAAERTAEENRQSAADAVEESEALDGLGLTPEQIEEVKSRLIADIQNSMQAADPGQPEMEVQRQELEQELEAEIEPLLAGWDEEISRERAALYEAAAEIPELEIPEAEPLSEEEVTALNGTMEQMEKSLAVISGYAKGISDSSDALGSLAGAMDKIRSGVNALSKGSGELTRGIGAFEEALKKTSEGSSQLNKALEQASEAGGTLSGAYGQLVSGMQAFADGVSEFDKEGIQSLAELTGPEYLALIRNVRAARDAEHSYANFSGLCDGQKGSVRFIVETEEIRADN